MHDRAERVAQLECERHMGGPRGGMDGDPLLQQERGADSGVLSLCSVVAPQIDPPSLGNITHHEKKSDCLVVMGRGHDTRRHELDRRR